MRTRTSSTNPRRGQSETIRASRRAIKHTWKVLVETDCKSNSTKTTSRKVDIKASPTSSELRLKRRNDTTLAIAPPPKKQLLLAESTKTRSRVMPCRASLQPLNDRSPNGDVYFGFGVERRTEEALSRNELLYRKLTQQHFQDYLLLPKSDSEGKNEFVRTKILQPILNAGGRFFLCIKDTGGWEEMVVTGKGEFKLLEKVEQAMRDLKKLNTVWKGWIPAITPIDCSPKERKGRPRVEKKEAKEGFSAGLSGSKVELSDKRLANISPSERDDEGDIHASQSGVQHSSLTCYVREPESSIRTSKARSSVSTSPIHMDLGGKGVDELISEPSTSLRQSRRTSTVEKRAIKSWNLKHVLFLEPTLKRQAAKRRIREREERRQLRKEAHRLARKDARRRTRQHRQRTRLQSRRNYLLDDFAGTLVVASRKGDVPDAYRKSLTRPASLLLVAAKAPRRKMSAIASVRFPSPSVSQRESPSDRQNGQGPFSQPKLPSDRQPDKRPLLEEKAGQRSPKQQEPIPMHARDGRAFAPIILEESDEEYDWDDDNDDDSVVAAAEKSRFRKEANGNPGETTTSATDRHNAPVVDPPIPAGLKKSATAINVATTQSYHNCPWR
jgi:hypothetical protein